MPHLTESMEHYLSAILQLSQRNGTARMRDISRAVGVKTSSATNAVQALVQGGFAAHETYGYVELTRSGKKLARDLISRREALVRFLVKILGVDPELAEQDACGMEHSISAETRKRLIKFIEFMESSAADNAASSGADKRS